MKSLMNDVAAFHQAMGCGPDAAVPLTNPPDDLIKLRLKLITEEFIETVCSMIDPCWDDVKAEIGGINRLIDQAHTRFDILGCADGLADLIYVCVGAALAFGIPLDRVWAEVQRANMAKSGGPRRGDGKILKPEGWQPPAIEAAIFGGAA